MKMLPVLVTAIFLLQPATVETTDERRFNILKFGQTSNDYVKFTHDMSQFETGFTVCSWVRKLRNDGIPTWFSYAVSNEEYEIGITDMGRRTRIFGDETDLRSLYTVTPGTWFHNCISWDSATSTRDVYIDGVRVDSKATPAGRTLGQGGTIVLGNEQEGVGTRMDTWNMFWGELYKLNMFTRKLNDSEIREMSEEMCSEVEKKHGEERSLKWEEVLEERKYGNVTESWSVCSPIRKLQSELLEIKERLNSTLEELERTKQEKEAYLADLQEKEEQLNSTSEELEQTKSDLEKKEEQLNSTSEELEQTKSDLENKEEQLNSTSEELKQTKSDLEKKEEQLNSTSEELEQTKSDLENKEEQLNSTSEELKQTKSDLENKEERLNSTSEELKQTKSDLEKKEEQLNSTSEELEQTKSDLENKKEQLNSTSEELKQTKSDLESKEEQLNSTSEELKQTKSDLEIKEERLNSTSEELKQTKSDLENKEEQLNSTSEELEQTKETLNTLQDTLENTTRHLNWTTRQLEQIRTDKDICLETKEDQTGRLEASETQRQKIQEELYNTTRKLNTTSHSLHLTRTQLAQVRVQLEKFSNFTPVCSPNSTVNSHWDLLYSERFFGGVVTEEKLEVLRTSIQKLG